MMIKTNGFVTVDMFTNKADTSRVFCPLRGSEVLEPIFEKLTALCKELGTEAMVCVDYDLEKKAVVCDVYEDLDNDKVIIEDVSLSKAQRVLEKVIQERKEAEYRKKVFAEAAEIAAKFEAEAFRVRVAETDMYDDSCDYRLYILGKGTYYHEKEMGWYTYETNEETGEIWKKEAEI